MHELICQFRDEIDNLKTIVTKHKSQQISKSSKLAKKTLSIVVKYFKETHPQIKKSIRDESLASLRDNLQILLDTTHKSSMRSTYIKRLKDIYSILSSIEKEVLTAKDDTTVTRYDEKDKMIIDTLKQINASAAHSYEQALIDLNQSNRLSWRGPATDFRESLRDYLDCLAPDESVVKQPNFKFEDELKKPTMKQKVKFVLKTRELPDNAISAPTDATEGIENLFRSVYNRASISTHIQTNEKTVHRLHQWVKLV